MTEGRLRARQTVLLADVPAGPTRVALDHLGVLVDRLLRPGSSVYEIKDPTVDLTSLLRSGLTGLREFLTEAGSILAGTASTTGPTSVEAPVDLTAEVAAPELLVELALARGVEAPGTAGPVAPVPEDIGLLAGWIVEEIANQLRGASPRPWTAR